MWICQTCAECCQTVHIYDYKRRHTHFLNRGTHTDTHTGRTYTCRVLLLLLDKSLSIDHCLCTVERAEGERKSEKWTHVINLFQLQRHKACQAQISRKHSHFSTLVYSLQPFQLCYNRLSLFFLLYSFFFSFFSTVLLLSCHCLATCLWILC